MNKNENLLDDNITKILNDPDKVTRIIQSGIQDALLKHKQAGNQVCEWRDNKAALPTNMNANTEHELRLYIIEKTHAKSKESKAKFYDIYMATKRFFSIRRHLILAPANLQSFIPMHQI